MGIRIDKVVLVRFEELCKGERLRVGGAFQRLMEVYLEVGSVIAVLKLKGGERVVTRLMN